MNTKNEKRAETCVFQYARATMLYICESMFISPTRGNIKRGWGKMCKRENVRTICKPGMYIRGEGKTKISDSSGKRKGQQIQTGEAKTYI